MRNGTIFTSSEKEILRAALKRLIFEGKPVYEGYIRYLLKEIVERSKREVMKIGKSKEGQ
ncbi:MAG: hypothetical protein N2560_05070 [Ignavibacteria bacterium]|nr:hypothetical protein [Ignavibacteria bacterium]